MCGIAGFFDSKSSYDFTEICQKMGQAIHTRGPDSAGIWQDKSLGINLIHRRLAILDLSEAGHQPMLSKCGRYVMVFNGEIYNYQTIKQQLEQQCGQINWRGHSDTEVILHSFSINGILQTIQQMEGMFAIALWDRSEQDLYLIRDRMGEKPLYYGYFNGIFAFTSELKALRQHPKFTGEINRDAVGQLLLHSCIPAPLSIFNNIFKLLPGHYLKLSYVQYINSELPETNAYWQLKDYLEQNYCGDENQAVDELDLLLKSIIKEQMIADVPVGCFLSGGVDSSTIAAIMQNTSSKPINTFSIGFDNLDYNEAKYAAAVAKYIGSNHSELYVNKSDVLSVIPELPSIYDEPFADSSQIPTYLVAKLAKQAVKVSLSGDGGDELFAGYTRHKLAHMVYQKLQAMPAWSKSLLIKFIPLFNTKVIHKLNELLNFPIHQLQEKLTKLENLLQAGDLSGVYLSLTGNCFNYREVVKGITPSNHSVWLGKNINLADPLLYMQYLDSIGYLPDDILVKVDRAAMANSLETRVPFLHHRLVEFAYSLPNEYKIKGKQGKFILRQVLDRYVPANLIERPKVGFAVPIHDWLRDSLKDWMINLLDESKLRQEGFFNEKIILQKMQAHLTGKANNGHYLWSVLMFQQWLEYWEKDSVK